MVDLLILGVHGQLGRAIERCALRRGLDVTGHDVDTLDIRDQRAVETTIHGLKPATVVNCAAFTDVDACESDSESAFAVNAHAVGHLATACNAISARLVHISTDYVFAGDGTRPYGEVDHPSPRNVYGRSKLAGEELAATADQHLIVRTAWLYGHGGRNFVKAIRAQVEAGTDTLRVVSDQVGSPTFCDDLADAIQQLEEVRATGIVHGVNFGSTSWHGFAVEIVRLLGAHVTVTPVNTSDVPRPASRPANAVLDTTRLRSLIGHSMPAWQDGLARYLEGSCES
jgi:dTDP-4-dehydrorhamnose reductase